KGDDLYAQPPTTFPGKLTASIYKRFLHYNGDKAKGLIILPTELINDNGFKLKEIVISLASVSQRCRDFINWVNEANYFCNTLVDRIVPGKLNSADRQIAEKEFGYIDGLAIMAEPFKLWAIETDRPEVLNDLSFADADDGVIISPDINK